MADWYTLDGTYARHARCLVPVPLLRLFLVLLLSSLLFLPSANADRLSGKVVRVLDGDTVEVLDANRRVHRVRLAGIDAPESGQPHGTQATRVLSKAVAGETLIVDWHKRDRYDRLVGKLLLDGADVNLALVRAGYAWWYRAYAGEQTARDRKLYEAAEQTARRERVGLWRDPQPIAPWDWRSGLRSSPASPPSSGACPCDSGRLCTGPRGGVYCVLESGSKKYFPRN